MEEPYGNVPGANLQAHHYLFELYTLDKMLEVPRDVTLDQLKDMAGQAPSPKDAMAVLKGEDALFDAMLGGYTRTLRWAVIVRPPVSCASTSTTKSLTSGASGSSSGVASGSGSAVKATSKWPLLSVLTSPRAISTFGL